MNITDEEEIKRAVTEAEYELSLVYEPYHEAEKNLEDARRRLEQWYELYG